MADGTATAVPPFSTYPAIQVTGTAQQIIVSPAPFAPYLSLLTQTARLKVVFVTKIGNQRISVAMTKFVFGFQPGNHFHMFHMRDTL
jgi:hypothetical protein